MTQRLRGSIEMTAAMLISGTIGLFVVLSGQPTVEVVFWRCVFGSLTLLVICALMGLLRRRHINARQVALAAIGGVAIVINWLLLFAAYPKASISVATTVYNTQPFMLVAMGALFLGERVTAAKLSWLVLAFAGTVAIAQAGDTVHVEQADYLAGIGLALGAAFFYALAAIVAKRLKGVPPQLIALIQLGVGIVMLAPFMGTSQIVKPLDSWAMLITLGVVHTGVMYILLYGAIQKLPTHLTGSLSFIYPLVAVIVDLLAFGHHLSTPQILGGLAILLAAAGSTLNWALPWPKARKAAPTGQ